MGRVAFVGTMRRDLEPALIERVGAARRSDRHRPLSILVGSNLLASHLGRALSERLGGLFNLRLVTFADLARELAAAGPMPPRAPIPPFASRVLIDELLASGGVPAAFEAAAGTRGFGAALEATFADLSEGGCTIDRTRAMLAGRGVGARLGDKARATLELFVRYRDRVEKAGGDLHSIFRDALEGSFPESLGSTLYAFGFYDFNEMQWRLLERVAERAEIELFVPWDGGNAAYRFGGALRNRLEAAGFDVRDLARAEGIGSAPPELVSLPGEEEEVREIARRILTLARERDVPFRESAVVLASTSDYAGLLADVFDEAGIPCSLPERPFVSVSPAARAARSLLSILERGLERRELVELLASAPLAAADEAGSPADHIALWIHHGAEAGIAGERGWIEESEALTARVATAVERGELRARSLAAARTGERLVGTICNAIDSMRKASTWAALSGRFTELIGGLFASSADVEKVRDAVESFALLDALGCVSSPERFFRLAGDALDDARAERRGSESGVRVLSLREARGLPFEAVFLPGLVEGSLPGAARQDPLLSDADRVSLSAVSKGKFALSLRGERIAEETLLFALALESPRVACTVSYPRFQQGTGRQRTPSAFLRYAGFDATPDGDFGAGVRLGPGGASRRGLELISLDEYDFESSREVFSGGGMPPLGAFFGRGVSLVRGRSSHLFTEYDGVISSARARTELASSLERGGYRFAPTALERWSACPFSYFLRDVLGMEAIEEPERIVTATPAQRGLLVHAILARLFVALSSEGLLPVRNAPPERLFAAAEKAARRILDEFPSAEPVGLPVFWEMERRLVMESIRLFLEEERLDEEEFVPLEFEKPFGRGADRESVAHDRGDRPVFFRGRIDRIDVAPDGRFRVIDYKTGKLVNDRDQDLGGGTKLQLPVYLLAASRLLGRAVEDGEALYRRVGALGKQAVRFSGSGWSVSGAEFAAIVETVTRGIERGLFFASAAGGGCARCGFKIACPPGAEGVFKRKSRSDPRAKEYIAMRGIAGEEES